jgi:predicted anti-sigma-YlaC factor YlaD
MTCQEYLSRHSDYLDGVLDAQEVARCQVHLEGCSSCARFHEVLTRSLALVTELPAVEPSADFQERLQHRLLHLQDELARHDRFAGTGSLVSLAIAAVIAMVAWGPLLMQDGTAGRTGQASAAPTSNARVAGQNDRTRALEWYDNAPGMPALDGASSLSAAFPGPYSPLIVEAPVTRASQRAARAVFAAYYPALE